MAKDPCSFGPFLLVPADAEEVHEPVQVGLEVGLLHSREPDQVPSGPRAEVARELHGLQVRRVVDVGLVGLVGALGGLRESGMGALHVVHDDGARGYMREKRLLDALGGRLAMAADHGYRVLEGVDRDRDADLALGEPALLHEVGAANDIGIGRAGLIDPDAPAQDEPVLVAVDRCEDSVTPLEGGLVPDPADLGNEVCGRVAAHARDKALPGRKLLLAVLKFIRRSEEQRVTSADAVIDGLVWEMKAPTADNLKAVERNLKRGRWQSENIVFDCRRMKKVPDAAIEREVRK